MPPSLCPMRPIFFASISLRVFRSLRADQLKKLVGALKIQLLLGTVLRPASVDGRFCGVERAIVNAAHYGNFKMKAGLLLAHFNGGKSTYSLVGAIERSDEL